MIAFVRGVMRAATSSTSRLYVAGSMVNTAAHNQAADPKNGPMTISRIAAADAWSVSELLEHLESAVLGRDSETLLEYRFHLRRH